MRWYKMAARAFPMSRACRPRAEVCQTLAIAGKPAEFAMPNVLVKLSLEHDQIRCSITDWMTSSRFGAEANTRLKCGHAGCPDHLIFNRGGFGGRRILRFFGLCHARVICGAGRSRRFGHATH